MNFDTTIISNLKDKDLASEGLVALEGRFVIEKAIAAGVMIEGLVCVGEREAEWLTVAEGRFPVQVLTHAEFSSIVGFPFHRGELAVGRRPNIPRISDMTDEVAEVGKGFASEGSSDREASKIKLGKRVLGLWNVTDPSNVGGLIRSAVALGADSVLLGPGTANPFYRKAIRASMGNVFSVRLWAMREEDIDAVRKSGIFLVAATLSDNAESLDDLSWPRRMWGKETLGSGTWLRETDRPLALFVGNEGYGLPQTIVEACDMEIYLPMTDGVDSLNVNVAAGILMYELFGV